MNRIKDITDFRDAAGESSVLDSLKNDIIQFKLNGAEAQPVKSDWPAIINGRDLLHKDLKKPPQLIKGLLHQGSKMVLGGGSKSYKTWSLLDLAMSVATGQPWWGFDTTKGRVLFINLELSEWSMQERMEEIQIARPELLGLSNLDFWNLRGHAVSFEKMRPLILEQIKEGYALIIIDPIYKVYGSRDENSAGEMGELLNEIEALAVKSGAAVVFGAHFSKGNQAGKESIDRISGSGVFARDPDSILIMTKHELEDTFTVEATLRNLKPVKPFCVIHVHPLMERNDEIDPSNLKQPGFKKKYSADQLLDVLGDQNLSTTDWSKQVQNATGMSDRTFMKLRKVLEVEGTKIKLTTPYSWSKMTDNATEEKGVTAVVQ